MTDTLQSLWEQVAAHIDSITDSISELEAHVRRLERENLALATDLEDDPRENLIGLPARRRGPATSTNAPRDRIVRLTLESAEQSFQANIIGRKHPGFHPHLSTVTSQNLS